VPTDLPVDDRTEKYGALSTGSFFTAGAVTQIVLHQTEIPTGARTLDGYAGEIKTFKDTGESTTNAVRNT
jgi:hypothetical protein